MKPAGQHSMTWTEFGAFVREMQQQLEPSAPPVDSWAGADSDPGWQELRRQRDEASRG